MSEAELDGSARHLHEGGLIAVAWVGVGLATFFVVLRTRERHSESRRLFGDDYWMLAAYGFLVINAVLQTLQTPSLYYLVYLSVGQVPAGETLVVQGSRYTLYEFVVIGLFWTILWCVKASFLALFWRLFDGLPVYRRLWWVVMGFAILSYIGCWLASVFTCHPASNYFKFGQCSKPIDERGGTISISYSTAVDILSDIMIMLLPLRLLSALQVTFRQKVGLTGIFCVGLLIIATSIVRVTQIVGQERKDPVGLAVWGLVESSVSVIVGSLPPLKGFLARKIGRTGRSGYGGSASSRSRKTNLPGSSYNSSSRNGTRGPGIPLEDTVTDSVISSKGQIVVSRDFGWASGGKRPSGPAVSESETDLNHPLGGRGGRGSWDEEAHIINDHQRGESESLGTVGIAN